MIFLDHINQQMEGGGRMDIKVVGVLGAGTMGNGIALVPGISVEQEVARGELVRIPVRDLTFERKLRLVYRRKGVLSHAARAFLQVAQRFSEEHGGRYLYQTER